MSGGTWVPLEQRIVDIDRWIRAGQEFFLDDLVKLKANKRQYCVHELAPAVRIMISWGLVTSRVTKHHAWDSRYYCKTVHVKVMDLRDLPNDGEETECEREVREPVKARLLVRPSGRLRLQLTGWWWT